MNSGVQETGRRPYSNTIEWVNIIGKGNDGHVGRRERRVINKVEVSELFLITM